MKIEQSCEKKPKPIIIADSLISGTVYKIVNNGMTYLKLTNGHVCLNTNTHYPHHTGTVEHIYVGARIVLE